jgi:hypothetical protein
MAKLPPCACQPDYYPKMTGQWPCVSSAMSNGSLVASKKFVISGACLIRVLMATCVNYIEDFQ